VATPEQVAKDIVRAVERKRDVLYTPRFWWGIMLVIRCVLRVVFKRVTL
jgi:short-subunit dehydrogenase